MHDVQWSPSGEHFITVAGFMPAKSTVFTEACKPFFDLGSGGHNLVRWSPQVCDLHISLHSMQGAALYSFIFMIFAAMVNFCRCGSEQGLCKCRGGLWRWRALGTCQATSCSSTRRRTASSSRWVPQGDSASLSLFETKPSGDTVLSLHDMHRCADRPFACRADNAVSLEWAPDGRSVLTATTAPRLRVDNGFQIYKYAHIHACMRPSIPQYPPSPSLSACLFCPDLGDFWPGSASMACIVVMPIFWARVLQQQNYLRVSGTLGRSCLSRRWKCCWKLAGSRRRGTHSPTGRSRLGPTAVHRRPLQQPKHLAMFCLT